MISENWQLAAIRADDLGDHASQLAYIRRNPDEDWRYIHRAFADLATRIRRRDARTSFVFDIREWDELYLRIIEKIDREYDPLE